MQLQPSVGTRMRRSCYFFGTLTVKFAVLEDDSLMLFLDKITIQTLTKIVQIRLKELKALLLSQWYPFYHEILHACFYNYSFVVVGDLDWPASNK